MLRHFEEILLGFNCVDNVSFTEQLVQTLLDESFLETILKCEFAILTFMVAPLHHA